MTSEERVALGTPGAIAGRPPDNANLQITVAEHFDSMSSPRLYERGQSRRLLYLFAWRDLKIRYKQTVLMSAWAVIQPLTATVIVLAEVGCQGPFTLQTLMSDSLSAPESSVSP
jgi:hypothetical protein